MEGLEARTEQLSAAWQDFANKVLSSDFVSDGLRILTQLLELASTDVGAFIAQLVLLSGTALVVGSSISKLNQSLNIVSGVSSFVSNIKMAFSMVESFDDAVAALTLTMEANPLFAVGAAIGAVALIGRVVDALTVTLDEQKEKVKDLTSEYKTLETRIESLENKGEDRTEQEEITLQILKEQREVLREQLALESKKALKKEFGEGSYNIAASNLGIGSQEARDYLAGKAEVSIEQFAAQFGMTVDELEKKLKELNVTIGNNVVTLASSYEDIGTALGYDSDIIQWKIQAAKDTIVDHATQVDFLVSKYNDLDKSSETYVEDELAIRTQMVKLISSLNEMEDILGELPPEYQSQYEELKNILGIVDKVYDSTEVVNYAENLKVLGEQIAKDFAESGKITEATLKSLTNGIVGMDAVLYDSQGNLNSTGKIAVTNATAFMQLANAIKVVEVQGRSFTLAQVETELESISDLPYAAIGVFGAYVASLKGASQQEGESLADIWKDVFSNIPTGSGGGSSEDKRLTALKNVVSTRKSELTLMEKQGKSADDQVTKMKQIQQALHEQAEYLRATGAAQSDINALSSEWWDIQVNINELLKEQYDNRIALLESELSLLEKTSASDDERISKIKDIQSELEAEYRFMQDIGSSQEELNELAAKWYDLQEDINSILRDTAQKQIDAIQDQIDQLEAAIDYVVDKAQEEIDKLEDAKDAVEARYDAEKERIQEQINNLEKTNDALEKEITLQEKLDALARAKTKKKYVYKDGRFQYVDDIDAINEAQKELNDFIDEQARQEAIDNLNKGIDDLESAKNKELEILDQEIKGWEDFQKQWGNIVDNYQKEQDRLIAEQVFGINLEGQNWETRLGNLQSYVSRYNDLQSQLKQAQANYDSIGSGGASFEPGTSSAEQQKQNIIAQMKANSAAWMVAYNAGDKAEMARLEAENQRLGAMIGAVYNSGQGKWYDGTTGLPLYAKGTISAKGGISIVGEEGAEMRILNKGDGIIPANMTANLMEIGKYSLPELLSMAGGSEGGATTIHIETVELPNVRDVDDFVTTLANNFVNRAIQVGSNRT